MRRSGNQNQGGQVEVGDVDGKKGVALQHGLRTQLATALAPSGCASASARFAGSFGF